MYYRYFRVDSGPLIEALKAVSDNNEKSNAGYGEIADSLGVSEWMLFGQTFAGFIFETEPDMSVWRQLPKYSKVYAPRKNVPAGKALWKRINAVVKKMDYNEALDSIDAPRHWFCIDSNRMTRAAICAGIIGEIPVFVQVPWKDADPDELAKYAAQKALPKEQQNYWDSELEHLLWTPHPSMVEVKEWEMLKFKAELAAAKKFNAPQN